MKWSILSLHSALQGMMAFHLSLGNDFFVMGKRDLAKWLEAHEDVTSVGHYGTGNVEFTISSEPEFNSIKEFVTLAYNKVGS